MKKLIFGLIAIVTIPNLSFGQATLEQQYSTIEVSRDFTNAFKTDTGLHYFTVEAINILKVYNSSHSLTSTTTIPIDNGYTLDGVYPVSDKLFNTDNLMEFIIFTFIQSGPGLEIFTYKMTLINQNGTILQQFGDRAYANIIKESSEVFKLIAHKTTNENNTVYDVYSLPGTTLGTVMLNKNSNSLFGFPNPTENKITITNTLENGQNGTLEVFDTNGKKVMQKNVVGENGEINLDVTKLSSGVYIYKLNGQTNRFIKK
jgi:Secretion system C-terminal sorting domain